MAVDMLDSDLNNEAVWADLYTTLRPSIRYLVYSFQVSSWRGQEEDLIEDVIQETIRRTIERMRKAERGEAEPVRSLKSLMITIAQNYCRDLRRSDHRLSLLHSVPEIETHIVADEEVSPISIATENVFQELIFTLLAHEIALFPNKQRKALLTDLANRMSFDSQPTPMQKAFLQEGIQLKEYQQSLPATRLERSRYAALLSCAYQRIAHLTSVQDYIQEQHDTNSSALCDQLAS